MKNAKIAITLCLFALTVFSGVLPASAANFEQPVLIVSIGQSADSQMVRVLAERNGIAYTFNPVATPSDLGGAKTLALVIGGSSKGMGAAGVNMSTEEKRAKGLIAAAKANNAKIILLHVGGEQRRGALTDRFIALLPDCDYGIVVADADKDGAFTKAAANKIPLSFPLKVVDVGPVLKGLF